MPALKEPRFAGATRERGVPTRGVQITPMASRRGVTQPEDRHRLQEVRRPYLLEHDMLLVTSIDDVTWKFAWDHRTYLLKPGETLPLPLPAVVNALGDPRSAVGEIIDYHAETGERGAIPPRYEQLTQLFARYGIIDEDVTALVDFAPKVTVTTMTGETVVFPSQNPEMAPWPVPHVAEPGREQPVDQKEAVSQLQAENAAMRAELDRMHARINERLGGSTADADDEDGPGAIESLGGAVEDSGPRARV